MNGWLVVNEFLHSPKFEEIYDRLIQAFHRRCVSLQKKTNASLVSVLNQPIPDLPDFVLFWDKDVLLARHLENMGCRLFNRSSAIADCDDKGKTALVLEKSRIPHPKTIIAPFKFSGTRYTTETFLDFAIEQFRFPFILKERTGSFGAQVHLVQTREELFHHFHRLPDAEWIFQEYIATSFGRDVRVQTLGNKIAAAAARFGREGDFRSNVTAGGRMEPIRLTDSFAETALAAAKELQLDFAGIDLLYGEGEKPIVCEVNSNAHFVNLENRLGISFADMLADYIIRESQK